MIDVVVEIGERGDALPRLPEDPDVAVIEGVSLPRLRLDSSRSSVDHALAVDERIGIVDASEAKGREFRLNIAPQCTKMVCSPVRRKIEPAD